MAIKISDLSVGDWVRYKGEECTIASIYMAAEGYPHEVALTHQGISCGLAYIDYLEPILITPEILKANGFEEHCGGIFRYEWMWQGESSGITLCSFDEELWFVDLFFKEGKDIMCNIPTFSIHQLQHILRLAGVDKEIVMSNK